MIDYAGHYRDAENGMRQLVAGTSDRLSREEVAEVEEFLDVREYGLALETLSALLLERHVSLQPWMVSEIRRLAEGMNIFHEQAVNNLIAEHERNYRLTI